MTKTPEELELMAEAGRLLASVFTHLDGLALLGLSAMQVNDLVDAYIVQDLKARPASKGQYGYGYALNASRNDVVCHGVPAADDILRDGDIVNFDITLFAATASAQTIGIGTTQGGATGQIGIALAQVISKGSGYQAVPRVSANTSQYIPLVDSGQIEFGIANYPQTYYAVKGTGMSTEASPNLRLVASLMPFLAGLVAPESANVVTYKDLAGKAVPRYQANSLGDFIISAALAAGGLTYDDVKSVPVANFPQQYEAFKDRRIDVSIATVGSQPTFELEAAVGKISFIAFEPSQLPALAKFLPGVYLVDVAPDAKMPGIAKGTRVFGYDYLLFAHKDVDDKMVGAVAKAIYEGEAFLKSTSPLWVDFDPKLIGKPADIPMHPGATAFYKSVGIN